VGLFTLSCPQNETHYNTEIQSVEHININNAYIFYRILKNASECYKYADAFYGDTIDCLRMLTAKQRMLTCVTGNFRKLCGFWGEAGVWVISSDKFILLLSG
jgi:hypothetical protein